MPSGKGDPLPPGWIRGFSQSNQAEFFVHKETNTTQWHFPTASEAKNPELAKQRADQAKQREQERAKSGGGAASSKRPRPDNDSSERETQKKRPPSSAAKKDVNDDFLHLADATSVAVIVPYRDLHVAQNRAKHLNKFIPHMVAFLQRCQKNGLVSYFHVYIVEQSNDQHKFNRGKLLNIGFDMARKSHTKKSSSSTNTKPHPPHDVFIFHDVDLLPADNLASWYTKFPTKPIHIARVWDRYSNNPKYFGGVVSFSLSDYKRINGYPNNFWGWGGEDDEMQRRLERLGIQFVSPDKGTLTDLEEMDIKEKMAFLREHKEWKCMVKWELQDEHESTWKTNGLVDLKYSVRAQTHLDSGHHSSKITVDVKLNGSHWTNEKAGVDFVETYKK